MGHFAIDLVILPNTVKTLSTQWKFHEMGWLLHVEAIVHVINDQNLASTDFPKRYLSHLVE